MDSWSCASLAVLDVDSKDAPELLVESQDDPLSLPPRWLSSMGIADRGTLTVKLSRGLG